MDCIMFYYHVPVGENSFICVINSNLNLKKIRSPHHVLDEYIRILNMTLMKEKNIEKMIGFYEHDLVVVIRDGVW